MKNKLIVWELRFRSVIIHLITYGYLDFTIELAEQESNFVLPKVITIPSIICLTLLTAPVYKRFMESSGRDMYTDDESGEENLLLKELITYITAIIGYYNFQFFIAFYFYPKFFDWVLFHVPLHIPFFITNLFLVILFYRRLYFSDFVQKNCST
ncbi:hypothetical protein ACWM35_09515 [Neobacillus sp. K501]